MSLLTRLFGTISTEEPTPEPDPEPERVSMETELTVYAVTLHYQNGDTETFEAYNEYSRDGNAVRYNVEVTARRSWHSDEFYFGYNRRSVNFGVLTREPIQEEIGTETWRITCESVGGVHQRGTEDLERVSREVKMASNRDADDEADV